MSLDLLINHQTLDQIQHTAEFEDYLYDSGIYYDEDIGEYICDGDTVDLRNIANEYLRELRCFHEQVNVTFGSTTMTLMCFRCSKVFSDLQAFQNNITAPANQEEEIQPVSTMIYPLVDSDTTPNTIINSSVSSNPTWKPVTKYKSPAYTDYVFLTSNSTSDSLIDKTLYEKASEPSSEEIKEFLKEIKFKKQNTNKDMIINKYLEDKKKENENDN